MVIVDYCCVLITNHVTSFVDKWLFFSGGGLQPEVTAMISLWSSGSSRWFPAKAVRFTTRKLYL